MPKIAIFLQNGHNIEGDTALLRTPGEYWGEMEHI